MEEVQKVPMTLESLVCTSVSYDEDLYFKFEYLIILGYKLIFYQNVMDYILAIKYYRAMPKRWRLCLEQKRNK